MKAPLVFTLVNTYQHKVDYHFLCSTSKIDQHLKNGKSGVNRRVEQENTEPFLALKKELEPRM